MSVAVTGQDRAAMLMESLTVPILLIAAIGVVLLEGFHFRAPFKRQRIVLMMGILLYV